MEVKNLRLEGDKLSGEFHCEYSAGIEITISEGIQPFAQATVNDEGFAPFVVYVHPDKPICNLNFFVFAPAGTSLWVPGGIKSVSHSVDLKKLRREPAKEKSPLNPEEDQQYPT